MLKIKLPIFWRCYKWCNTESIEILFQFSPASVSYRRLIVARWWRVRWYCTCFPVLPLATFPRVSTRVSVAKIGNRIFCSLPLSAPGTLPLSCVSSVSRKRQFICKYGRFFCSRIIFLIFFLLNLLLWAEESSAAIPFFTLVALVSLWSCVSLPLTFVGSLFGFRKRVSHILNHFLWVCCMRLKRNFPQTVEHPVRTNQIPRQIPEQSFYTQFIPGLVMGGVLPFGCIFIQLYFILNSIWWVDKSSSFLYLSTRLIRILVMQVESNVLYVRILIPGVFNSNHHLLGDDHFALLFPSVRRGKTFLLTDLSSISQFFTHWLF